jgi:hypothetical protein
MQGVDDIARVLRCLPAEHIAGLGGRTPLAGVVLRQPSRRQRVLAPVWGRMLYYSDVGPIHGPVVMIEASEVPLVIRWQKRQVGPRGQEEFERLLEDATVVCQTRREYLLTFEQDAIRAVQLYRTVVHEVGHLVHHAQEVELASERPGAEWRALSEAYWRRPDSERESFAHRYASEWGQTLTARSEIPFARRVDHEQIRADGLRLEDFERSSPAARGAEHHR